MFADGDGCDEELEWNSLESKALQYRLVSEDDDPNDRYSIIKAEGVH
jgi:hypothetical protein